MSHHKADLPPNIKFNYLDLFKFSLLSVTFPLRLLCPGMGCHQCPFDSIIPLQTSFLSVEKGDLRAGHWTLDRMGRIAHSKDGIISICALFVYLCHRRRIFVADAFVYLSDGHQWNPPAIVLLLRGETNFRYLVKTQKPQKRSGSTVKCSCWSTIRPG